MKEIPESRRISYNYVLTPLEICTLNILLVARKEVLISSSKKKKERKKKGSIKVKV